MAGPKQGTENQTGYIESYRQTSDRGSRWDWVEASIWNENMLIALENGVKGGKWFSLIEKVSRMQTLRAAWKKVRANRGAAGIDKVSIKRFEANLERYLVEISEQLRSDTFRPMAVKRVHIPKGNGETRPLGIPTVKDRIVQMAIKLTIEPIFENEFLSTSYGFRPGRGTKSALRHVDNLLKEGYTHVVDVDFKAFFDTIPHENLMEIVKERISDGRVLNLIDNFLKQTIMDEIKEWKPIEGTPQGAVISPLLANTYLHPLDVLINVKLGLPMIRYADDFVVLAKSEAEAQEVMQLIKQWAESVGLIVHPEKSKIIAYSQGEAFEFLGYRFERGYKFVRKKSIQKLRDSIREKTRRTCGKSLDSVIEKLNSSLKGWYNHFKHAHKTTFPAIDGFVRRRLRAILRKQLKKPGFGRCINDSKRWPNAFFAKAGLFCLVAQHQEDVALYQAALAFRSRCRNL